MEIKSSRPHEKDKYTTTYDYYYTVVCKRERLRGHALLSKGLGKKCTLYTVHIYMAYLLCVLLHTGGGVYDVVYVSFGGPRQR